MKLSLLIKDITPADSDHFVANLDKVSFKKLSDDVLLVFHTGAEDEVLRTLYNGVSEHSTLALYELAGKFHGIGATEQADDHIARLFRK